MEFSLCCPCGETLIVSDVDAGRTRGCRCGVIYQVPPLVELGQRDAAGEIFLPAVRAVPKFIPPQYTAQESMYSEAEKLRALDRNGKLPLEQNCIFCCMVTKDVLTVDIDCEQAEVQRRTPLLMYIVIGLVFPIAALYRYIIDSDDKEVIGEDVSVRAPLRVCASCTPPLFAKPAAIREKMLDMRLYQALFQEFPKATIRIVE